MPSKKQMENVKFKEKVLDFHKIRPYYGKKEAHVISDNHLNRGFQASTSNGKWTMFVHVSY
ncbi:hypothetical protein COL21_13470 [Bacillus thuringiensis]|nr:hypothetical protein COL21_13470 [Bacillus thuringiensis]PGR86637.1 hypothetical protein COC68_32090 [Bacillus thuringiensis]